MAQAVNGMIDRRERLAAFSGAVGVTIEVVGDVALGIFSGTLLRRLGSRPGAQQPPTPRSTQGGGEVIPFPSQSPTAPPVPRPAASGM